jgi:tetratricopeptide (TPR) repeat protein
MVTFDDVYNWLNESDNRSYLSAPVQAIIENAKTLGGNSRSVSRVQGDIQLAIRISKSLGVVDADLEMAETYLECGRINYLMGDITGAITEFRQAASLYLLGGHKHNEAVARWLLGCAFWMRSNQGSAIVEWEKSCQLFQEIKQSGKQISSYNSRIDQLKKTLEDAIKAGGWLG